MLCALSFLATRLPLSRRGSLKRGRSGETADCGVAGDLNRRRRLVGGEIADVRGACGRLRLGVAGAAMVGGDCANGDGAAGAGVAGGACVTACAGGSGVTG